MRIDENERGEEDADDDAAGGEVGMEGDEDGNGVMVRMGWISGWDGSWRWRLGWRW